AKAANTVQLGAGLAYLRAYLDGSPFVLVLLPFALAATFATGRSRAASFGRFALLGLVLYVGYVVKVGGDFMHYRFMFEVYPAFLWIATAGWVRFARRAPLVLLPLALLLVVLARHETILDDKYHMET